MATCDNIELLKKLYDGKAICRDEWRTLLTALTADEKEALRSMAVAATDKNLARVCIFVGL